MSANKFELGDGFIKFGHYESSDKGLYFNSEDAQKHWLGAPLLILAETCDERGECWGLLVGWFDRDDRAHQCVIAKSSLAGDGLELRRQLLGGGYELTSNRAHQRTFLGYLARVKCPRRRLITSRVGWHDTQFVLPSRVIGLSETKPVIFQAQGGAAPAFAERGSLAEWQENVAKFGVGNSRLAFSLSCAFAGPLLAPTRSESGGFHIRGNSSTGKSTCLFAAGSVWGGGGIQGFVGSWRATANGLEGIAASHSDTFLALDEISQAGGRDAGQAAYMLANNLGKARAEQTGAARQRADWRILFLSTGEISLTDKVAEDNRSRRATAGQDVRVVDIPADAECGLGAFETLHGFQSAAALADQVKKSATEFYGAPSTAFLEKLVVQREEAARFVKQVAGDFVSQHLPPGCDGQVGRVLQRFGLVAAAGELATEWGILPWPKGEATRAAVACFKAWLSNRGGGSSGEHLAAISQVRTYLEKYGDSKFSSLSDKDEREPNERAGFVRVNDTGDTEYLILKSTWKDICSGLDSTVVAKALSNAGHLRCDAEGKTSVSMHVPVFRKNARLYVVRSSIFAAGDDQ